MTKLLRARGKLVAALAFASLPALAQAHPGHDGHELTWDFGAGFAHPFSGADHLLAMIAVGLWAWQLGGRARWMLPAGFVFVMALGADAGRSHFIYPASEQMMAATVLVLGLLIATAAQLPLAAGVAVTGIFAFFHGAAHGTEMTGNHAFASAAGFLLATAVLHLAGLALGKWSPRISVGATRLAGGAIAAAGIFLLAR